MNTKRLILAVICISLLLTVIITVSESNAVDWPFGGMIGERAPLFTLEDLDGNEVSLSYFKGKPVVLNFWATWCRFCRKERKDLNALHNKYKDKELVILSVSLDRSVRKLRSFIKDHPADYIVLTDRKKKSAAMYGMRSYPTTFLIDRDGIVRHKFIGARQWSSRAMSNVIDKLIK